VQRKPALRAEQRELLLSDVHEHTLTGPDGEPATRRDNPRGVGSTEPRGRVLPRSSAGGSGGES
jgi:hypothetical protein